ncbi:MFS transporter [Streptomyces bottropensis]
MYRTEGDGAHPRRWWMLGILSLALFAIVLNNGLLNVAIPVLMRELGADIGQAQWIVDSYALAFGGALLTAGAVADRFGRKRATLGGAAVFGAGSLIALGADSPGQLMTARVVMGLGAAFIMPGTLALIVDVFPESERARAIGVWSGVSALGVAAGPVAGGALVGHFWWGSIFLVNLVPVAVVLVGGALLLRESADRAPRPPDPVGALLGTAAVAGLVFGVIQTSGHALASLPVAGGLAVAAAAGTVFVVWERRHPHPLLDTDLLRRPAFIGASASILLLMLGLAGTLFVLTQRLQFVLGYTPLRSGLSVMPVALAVLLGTLLCPALDRRAGARGCVAVGLSAAACGVLVLGQWGEGYPPVFAGLVLIGVGFGLSMAPTTHVVMSLVPPERSGSTASLDMTMQELGTALGVAVVGSVLAGRYADALAGAPGTVGETLRAAERTGGEAGHVLAAAARRAFDDASAAGLGVAAAAVACGAVVAALLLPGRAGAEAAVAPSTAGPRETEPSPAHQGSARPRA